MRSCCSTSQVWGSEALDGGVPLPGITRQEVKEVICYLLGVTAVSGADFWMSLVLQALVS